ncbi:MAG: hypothetical protein M0Q48_01905 [Verrucomicrobia bacterium]|jgi:hypothetical protein|nr:hypothetical protein [Verrucomicrobiota bacterium]
MKKYLSLVLLLVCCFIVSSKPAETNLVKAVEPTKARANLQSAIERIDKLINALYEKEKLGMLNERDYLRLDRLQEARVLAELRLQQGTEDDGRIERLLSEAAENRTEEVANNNTNQLFEIDEKELLKETQPGTGESVTDKLAAIVNSEKQSEELGVVEPSIADAVPISSGDANLEKLMNLTPESLLHYREIVADANGRITEIDKKIELLQKNLKTLIDEEFPNYGDIYECSRGLMDALYDKSIEQVELRRNLRLMLTQSQMRIWMRYAWESQAKTKMLSPSLKSDSKILPEDEQIVYVPMRLQRTQISDGSVIYQAVPLTTPEPAPKEP